MTARRFLLVAAACCAAFSPSLLAQPPALLSTALQKFVEEDTRWAYTQTYRRVDRPSGETVARFDPSRPKGEQWKLIKFRGRTPTAAEADRWCQRREQHVDRSDARAVADLMDLERARVVEEQADSVRYEVPLRDVTIGRIPAANFVVFADVDRSDRSFRRFVVVLRESIRLIGGIAEIQSAEGEVLFACLDASGRTRPTRIIAQGTGQALFKKVNRAAEITFSEQRRVKG